METRYREQKRLFRKSVLVLQVSFQSDETGNDNLPPSMRVVHTSWRDAVVEDFALKDQVK